MELKKSLKHETTYNCKGCGAQHSHSAQVGFRADTSPLDTAEDALKLLTNPEARLLRPKEGDLSICAGCGNIAVFEADGNIRPLTAEEIVSIYQESEQVYFTLQKISREMKELIYHKKVKDGQRDSAIESTDSATGTT